MNVIQKYQKLFGKLNVVDVGDYTIYENDRVKLIRSENYNYDFSKIDGFFKRWGKTLEDDPVYCPFGPEIADIELCQVVNVVVVNKSIVINAIMRRINHFVTWG